MKVCKDSNQQGNEKNQETVCTTIAEVRSFTKGLLSTIQGLFGICFVLLLLQKTLLVLKVRGERTNQKPSNFSFLRPEWSLSQQVTRSPCAFFVKDDRLMLIALKKLKCLLRCQIKRQSPIGRSWSFSSLIVSTLNSQKKFLFWCRNVHNWCRNKQSWCRNGWFISYTKAF